jgi:hypothetical protein
MRDTWTDLQLNDANTKKQHDSACTTKTSVKDNSHTVEKWSGWADSNRRPPAPEAGALTGLRYTPTHSTKTYNKTTPNEGPNDNEPRGDPWPADLQKNGRGDRI